MATIVLTQKAKTLMKLCELEGYKRIHDFLNASMREQPLSRDLHDGGLQPHD